MLRDFQHEFNRELLCTPRHRIEERFQGTLCEAKKSESDKVPRLRSNSPGFKTKPCKSGRTRSNTMSTVTTASNETEWDQLSSFTTDSSSASDVTETKGAFETCGSLPELREQLQNGRLQYV